jgi:N-acetylglucosamine kinase-like BadF-type ATPase
MRRVSLYVTAEAIEAFDAAADQILRLLGDGTPRHVALSALLLAGARQADPVAHELARQRAAELAQRLAALQSLPE